MDALLILSGTFLLCAAWIWLVVQSRHLSIGLVLLALTFPLITVLMPRRGFALWPRLALCLGCLATAFGLGLLHQQQPERFAMLISGGWLDAAGQQTRLHGAVAGQTFSPQRVYWRDDELVFEEASAERVRRSLAIRFTSAPSLLNSTSIERIPTDAGEWPQLQLRWYQGALASPGRRTLTGEYSLDLDLQPANDGTTTLQIHLHLPTVQETWLVGDAVLEETPAWLVALISSDKAVGPEPAHALAQPIEASVQSQPGWHPVSLLALVDEPDLFRGTLLRLTTLAGRVHEGRLHAVSDDKRLVISQAHGANRVELHFQPLDIDRVEGFYAPK
ncbi:MULTISPECIES: hypothetical protein [Pseudomonas]|uniref:hypothetical protein n=1 Tax=Pseudomonas TaxID=286 RepID=UPI001239F962|nr:MULTISPECIES: hypothetical protein [Pseudomonas]QIB51893.1 hypothetical protein G3M63_13080 [Pseudomonas sp. OIL-1]